MMIRREGGYALRTKFIESVSNIWEWGDEKTPVYTVKMHSGETFNIPNETSPRDELLDILDAEDSV